MISLNLSNVLAMFKILYLDIKSFIIFLFTLFIGMLLYGYLLTAFGLSGWLGIIVVLTIVGLILIFFMGLFGLKIAKGKPMI